MTSYSSAAAPPLVLSPLASAPPQHHQDDALTLEVPPVPVTRGPGHTPREKVRAASKPPRRPPSRSSSRYYTPRMPGGDGWSPHVTKMATPMSRPLLLSSERSIQFIEDEPTDTGSIAFQVHSSTLNHRTAEPSLDVFTYSDGSDIHFTAGESQGQKRAPNPSVHNTRARSGASTGTLTSLHFEVESATCETYNSRVSDKRSERAQEVPVPIFDTDHGDDGDETEGVSAEAEDATDAPLEFLSDSEVRRRSKKAEEESRMKALRERSQYMNIRPWETNEPNPRARRTSSQSAAHALKQQKAEKMEEVEKRRQAMNARPWRTNCTTPNNRRSSTPMARRRSSSVPIAGIDGSGATAKRPVTLSSTEHEAPSDANISPANLAVDSHPWSPSSEYPCSSVAPTPYAHPGSPAWPNDTTEPLAAPPPAVFDAVTAAKFVTPAPVLKAPIQIVGEEMEDWTHVVTQRRNLQEIVEMMRVRERATVELSYQLTTKKSVMKRLNRELYKIRDDYVQAFHCDLTGTALYSPRSRVMPRSSSRRSISRPPSIVRLYTEPQHQAKDYFSMKMQQLGPQPVSVLSDDDLSESEQAVHALDLHRWRLEREALRDTKTRALHRRRDLTFQMRRGSNIKDISTIQPTSGRGPLERAAAGTETAVDVSGHDRLMDLRMHAQRAAVEAANAKKAYVDATIMEGTMKQQHNLSSAEIRHARESHKKAKEIYAASLRALQQSLEEARSLLKRAETKTAYRKKSAALLDDSSDVDMEDHSEAFFAVRMKTDRVEALAAAAPSDEDRMLRSASTPRIGMSRAGTPRGSINGFVAPRASARTNGHAIANGDGVPVQPSA